jgi:gluconolactonase
MPETLDDILDTTAAERLATGFEFTEGPLWHPNGFYYFVDIRTRRLYRIFPGKEPEVLRQNTGDGNGLTFDLDGNVIMCEMAERRVVRLRDDGSLEVVADSYEGKRLNRPNDVICASDGSIYFTDPAGRMPFNERELPAAVYCIAPDGQLTLVAECEIPNGLALSPDESVLYVANTRAAMYIHRLEMNPDGTIKRRGIFADKSSEVTDGVPDGMKVDSAGRVFCTGPGGTWVFAPDGTKIGVIETPEVPANLAFGGPDLRTLFLTARTSVYTLRVKTPGQPHPWYRARSR